MAQSLFLSVFCGFLAFFLVTAVQAQSVLEAVQTGNIQTVTKILRKSIARINEQDGRGITPLILATLANDSAMVDLLVRHRPDPDIQADGGMTALHAAAFHGRDRCSPLIIALGANPNIIDAGGRSPLHVAARQGNTNIVTQLCDAGAHINFRDRDGNSALMLACGNRHLGAMEELLEKGAFVHTRDLRGRTPLMLLAVLGEDEMMRVMLRYKPDLELVDHSGLTALTYAKINRRKTIIRILEAAGAKF